MFPGQQLYPALGVGQIPCYQAWPGVVTQVAYPPQYIVPGYMYVSHQAPRRHVSTRRVVSRRMAPGPALAVEEEEEDASTTADTDRHLVYVAEDVFRGRGVQECESLVRRLRVAHVKRFKSVEKLQIWLNKRRGQAKRGLQPILVRAATMEEAEQCADLCEDPERFPVVCWSNLPSSSSKVTTLQTREQCVQHLENVFQESAKREGAEAASTAASEHRDDANEPEQAECRPQTAAFDFSVVDPNKRWADFSSDDDEIWRAKDATHLRMGSTASTAATVPPASPR
mmetsp:Transcript_36494/g.95885  ORF Transcript_36494/g.95885 Transcript_36494/m.95885 type:complete len:284 (-) Transcript_36494:187-1038(-)